MTTTTAEERQSSQQQQQQHLVSNPPAVHQAEEEENKDDVSPPSCAAASDGEAKKEGDDHDHHQTFGGWTDDKFEEWLKHQLMKDPLHTQYPEIFDIAPSCITKWRKRYRGDKPTWHRIFDKDRVIKEFVEAVPIIDAVQRLVLSSSEKDNKNNKKYTIIDLACGKGYLSMLLSELLPPSRVEKFILIDKNWPEHGKPAQSHHISSTHIAGHYFDTWPIQLWISKQDLKKSNQRHNIEERYLSSGPVIMLAVHLCGILSLKAVDFFNNNPNICFFCLKPCCLPGMVHAKRKEIFTLAEHCFEAKEVCMAGKWKKNRWHGPPRTELRQYFNRWANNLYLGINDSEDGSKKLQKTVMVQTDGGYQNEFLFAERNPNTNDVWDALLKDTEDTTTAVAVAADNDINDDDGAKRQKRGE